MAEDREVLREVWQGRIPVAFSLSSDDVHTMGQPDPYHLMLPRLSYITVIFDKVCILLTLVTLEMVSIKRNNNLHPIKLGCIL
jgi:hypothetical protein